MTDPAAASDDAALQDGQDEVAREPDLEAEGGGVPEPTFLGEIVQKRSWVLIAVVFVFALILAAAPFLFMAERSPYSEALATYDRLCDAARDGRPADPADLAPGAPAADVARLRCVDRAEVRSTFHPVPGHEYGADRRFVLRFEPAGADPFEVMFVTWENRLVWRP